MLASVCLTSVAQVAGAAKAGYLKFDQIDDHLVDSVHSGVRAAVDALCSRDRNSPRERQACTDAKRFIEALLDSGRRLAPNYDDPWQVLEGQALRLHPDPLGALQRGEVPAIALRRFVSDKELSGMLSRMAQLTMKMFTCRYPVNIDLKTALATGKLRKMKINSNETICKQLNEHTGAAKLGWPNWCTLLANAAHDCEYERLSSSGAQAASPECTALRSGHPVFQRCRYDRGRKKLKEEERRKLDTPLGQEKRAGPIDKINHGAAHEFGQKLYGNLYAAHKAKFMRGTASVNQLHRLMELGCTARFCSPKQVMIEGIRELAGTKRPTQQAQESPGEIHSPGTIRAMTSGWRTPLHMDSKHSSAWAALRKEICGEHVPLSMGTEPREASRYHALTRHHFAASAIFTMHAPDRTLNPFDLNVFRLRWPALLRNCSVRTVDAYGVGARFVRDTMPVYLFARPLTVRADPGDLFLFNSEYFHDTPTIAGSSSRTVFNSFAGFSSDGGPVEVYA